MNKTKIDYFFLKEVESYVFNALRNNTDETFEFDGFEMKIKKHETMFAYVCAIGYQNYLINFIVEGSIIEDSLIPETVFADLICKQFKKMVNSEE